MKHYIKIPILIIFLASIYIESFAYDFEIDGLCYTITSFENNTVALDGLSQSASDSIEIPSSIQFGGRGFIVTSIYNCRSSKIKKVILPNTISNIGQAAFKGSTITEIYIPNSVISIGKSAFEGCKNLVNARISGNVSSLEQYLFKDCKKLTHFEWSPITTNLGSIGIGAFWGCETLKTISIPPQVTQCGGYNVSYYSSSFKDCASLDSLIIEDGKGYLRLYWYYGRENWYDDDRFDGEFQGSKISYVYLGRAIKCDVPNNLCYPNLKNVEHLVIGDSVVDVPLWLPNVGYYESNGLKKLEIGSSLSKVGDLSKNNALAYIKIKQRVPPAATAFSNYNYINTILYVPRGAKPAYQSAELWKNFWNIEEYDGDYEPTSKCSKPTISYSKGKISFDCETDDVKFHSTISNPDIKTYSENEVELGVTYNISVYAAKQGFENSEIARATLCWIDVDPKTEGVTNEITSIPANPIIIRSENGSISVTGANDGERISVYGINGTLLSSVISRDGLATIETDYASSTVLIVKIGERSFKISMN